VRAAGRSASLATVAREWLRIGVIGFGGPPAHIALLRSLVVDRRGWIDSREFEDANAACGLLPGPASTQMAIYCAQRVAGPAGAVVGGVAFIVPGLLLILALAAGSLSGSPPEWLLALAAGAGAAVVPVVAHAGITLLRASPLSGVRVVYVAAGAVATVLVGPYVVLVLLGCGLLELLRGSGRGRGRSVALHAWPLVVLVAAYGAGELPALAWTAFKVGALSYGGGFVIIPLMQGDAVDAYEWMTQAEFLNAVAFGQLTPGPVTQTVAVVGYAAAGVGGFFLAALVAFVPSFVVVLLGGGRFEALRSSPRARAFLDGAGPAAVGAIIGAAVPLAAGLEEPWMVAVALAAALPLALHRAPIIVLLAGAIAGIIGVLALDFALPPERLPFRSQPALLAQLVEHFHGKEGVAGSSPAEGFIGDPRYGGDFSFPRCPCDRTLRGYWVPTGSLRGPVWPQSRPLPEVRGGWSGVWRDFGFMRHTPFDDLAESAVLTPQDIADRLRIDARSVRRAIARGELAASRTCGLRVLAADAAAWWRGRLVEAPEADALPDSRRHPASSRRKHGAQERLPLPPRAGEW
jgi:chromate transporter